MNTQSNKNSLKKLISLVGVAGAGIFLSLPAFAGVASNSSFDQSVRNQISPTDSNLGTEQLLAQDSSGSDNSGGGDEVSPGTDDLSPIDPDASNNEMSSPHEMNRMNEMSSPHEMNRMNEMSSPRETNRMNEMSTVGEGNEMNKPYMQNTALRRLNEDTWRCLNNPSPECVY